MRLHCGLSDSKAGKASQQLGAFEVDQGDNRASEFRNQKAGLGTKIPHAAEQPSPLARLQSLCAATTELLCHRQKVCILQ